MLLLFLNSSSKDVSFFFYGLNFDYDVDAGKDIVQYIESSDDDEQGRTDSSDSDIYIISDCEGTNMHTDSLYYFNKYCIFANMNARMKDLLICLFWIV